jgi:threonine dehydrogenase-like Zn-dependent dehydrogenase
MRAGNLLGHEFMGEVAETGLAVRGHKAGDRVVVCSFVSCGRCWYCQQELFSVCDNGNPNPAITEAMWGTPPAAVSGTRMRWAASRAATRNTSGYRSPTRARSPYRTRSAT